VNPLRQFSLGSEYAAAMYTDDQLDGQGRPTARGLTRGVEGVRVDIHRSVSGSIPPELHWDDAVISQQERSFHNAF